jgi:hypothetical protein
MNCSKAPAATNVPSAEPRRYVRDRSGLPMSATGWHPEPPTSFVPARTQNASASPCARRKLHRRPRDTRTVVAAACKRVGREGGAFAIFATIFASRCSERASVRLRCRLSAPSPNEATVLRRRRQMGRCARRVTEMSCWPDKLHGHRSVGQREADRRGAERTATRAR